jgi:hypothetical protein
MRLRIQSRVASALICRAILRSPPSHLVSAAASTSGLPSPSRLVKPRTKILSEPTHEIERSLETRLRRETITPDGRVALRARAVRSLEPAQWPSVRWLRGTSSREPSNALALECSLTSCRDLSGESPDDRRFPVHRSSLTPSLVPRGTRPKAGVTKSSEGEGRHESSDRRSQSGGRGKAAGRSIKRTMQRRN